MARKKRRTQTSRPATASDAQPELSAEERVARREEQRREWAQQKRAEDRAASRSFAPLFWAGGVIVTLAVVIPVVLLVATGGGSGSGTPTPTPKPDARLGGQLPVATFAISSQDNGQNVNPRFSPNNFVARAGQVFEVDVKNDGSVFHNLIIDGGDGQFGTTDDWNSTPLSIPAGGAGKVLAKLDQPGTYQFECNLHAGVQIGTITVLPGASGSATPTPTLRPVP